MGKLGYLLAENSENLVEKRVSNTSRGLVAQWLIYVASTTSITVRFLQYVVVTCLWPVV